MMENGSARKTRRLASGQSRANGKARDQPNGRSSPPAIVEKKSQTQAQPPRPRRRIYRLANTAARLLAWFVIITVVFRCPPNFESCDESSPAVCAPYFQAKAAIAPHIAPYYETYAEPYVELARPYYVTAKERVLLPTYNYASIYAAPRVEQVRQFGQHQWEDKVQPRLDLYQQHTLVWYDGTVAPHVEQARHAIEPYLEISKDTALRTYHETILPAYAFVHPYALLGYGACADFVTNTAVPTATWAWTNAYVFLDRTVWPQIRFLYTENVEPQLLRIGERLGRHKQERVVAGASADNILQNALSSASSASSAISSAATQPTSSLAAIKSQSAQPTPAQDAKIGSSTEQKKAPTAASDIPADDDDFTKDLRPVGEIVADDLQKWESRYSQAAEDGVAAIVKRVDEICDRMVDKDVQLTGQRLLGELKASVEGETVALKQKILRIIETAPSPEEGSEAIAAAVRQAGLLVKERALDVRSWRQRFTEELQVQVTRAAQSNVQILDEIRDLALQKIGMKWAWMDGVTYKDWQNFHDLRSRLTEWTSGVKSLVVTHPGIEDAEDAAQDVEDAAMAVAQAAAQSLASIKQVGLWKLAAGDLADDFDPAQMAVADAPVSEAEGDGETLVAAEDLDVQDDDHLAVEGEAPSEDTVVDEGAPVAHEAEPPLPEGESPVDDALVRQADEQDAQTSTEHDAAEAGEPVVSSSEEAQQPLGSDDQPDAEPLHEEEVPEPDNLASESSEVLIEGATETTTEKTEKVEMPDVKPAFLGAAAREVPANGPILDEEADYLASITRMAQAAYSTASADAASRYSMASSVVSVQMYGTPRPVHEALLADLSASHAAAVAAASSQLSNVIEAASQGIHGTPTATAKGILPTAEWAKAEAIAAEKLKEGRVWAEMHYSSVKVALGLATATPTAKVDQVLEQAKRNYYAGLGVAQERYFDFLSAASSAFNSLTGGPTPTPTPTDLSGMAASLASVASASAASAAGSLAAAAGDGAAAAMSAANSVASAAGESIESAIAEVEGSAAEAALALAGSWDVAVSQISAQIYGQPTPLLWYEEVPEKIASAADKVAEKVAQATEVVKHAVEKDEL